MAALRVAPKWEIILAAVLGGILICLSFSWIVLGDPLISGFGMQYLAGISFLLAGYLYFRLRKKFPKTFAILAIGAAIASNALQINKIANSRNELLDRITFIIAGILLTGKGFKDFMESSENENKLQNPRGSP